MKITFYTIDCEHCKALEKKLKEANIMYDTVDIMQNVQFAMEHGFTEAPMLGVDDEFLDFTAAMKWLATRTEENPK